MNHELATGAGEVQVAELKHHQLDPPILEQLDSRHTVNRVTTYPGQFPYHYRIPVLQPVQHLLELRTGRSGGTAGDVILKEASLGDRVTGSLDSQSLVLGVLSTIVGADSAVGEGAGHGVISAGSVLENTVILYRLLENATPYFSNSLLRHWCWCWETVVFRRPVTQVVHQVPSMSL